MSRVGGLTDTVDILEQLSRLDLIIGLVVLPALAATDPLVDLSYHERLYRNSRGTGDILDRPYSALCP